MTHDLRAARILIDCRNFKLLIDEPGGGSCKYSFLLLPRRREFARYMLQAALSTHAPAALSEDALVG